MVNKPYLIVKRLVFTLFTAMAAVERVELFVKKLEVSLMHK